MWELDEGGMYATNKRNSGWLSVSVLLSRGERSPEPIFIDTFDTVEEAKARLAKIVREENAEEEKILWRVDEDGNAFNERHGEKIFFTISVLKQKHGCGEHRKNLGEFKSTDEARAFIKKTVDELNAEREK